MMIRIEAEGGKGDEPMVFVIENKWKKRYFVLSKPAQSLPGTYLLNYYSDENCKRVRGSIDLEQCAEIIEHLDSDQFQYLLAIKTTHKSKERTYFLATETEEQMSTWVQNLCSVCGMKPDETAASLPEPSKLFGMTITSEPVKYFFYRHKSDIEDKTRTISNLNERHKSDIEDKTRTISNLNERIRQTEETEQMSYMKNKSLTDMFVNINKLEQDVRERDQTIRKEKERKSEEDKEVNEKQKSEIEDKTRTISNLNNRIRQMEEAARVSDRKNKSLSEMFVNINTLKQDVRERDQTIRMEKEILFNEAYLNVKREILTIKKDLKETKSGEMDLRKKEKQSKENLTSLKTTYNELVQSKDRHVENLKEMEALKSKLEQDLSRKNDDYHFQQKDLNESKEQIPAATATTAAAEATVKVEIDDKVEVKLDGHCLDVCWNYDAAVKESLTNLTVTSKSKVLKPERTQEAENDTDSSSENGINTPSEIETTLPLREESEEEMTGNVGLCNTYLWHNKETEDIGGRCKMIKYKNDTDVKYISPESVTESECTGHVPAEGKKEEKGVEEKEGGKEEKDEGKGGKTEGKMESGSFKQTGRFKAEKKIEGDILDENNEYNLDVKSENGSSEAAPDIKKDAQELEDDTDCKKIDNIAEKERSHVELAYQNDKSAEECIRPESMTGSECTGHVPAEGNKEEKGAEEKGEREEKDEGKGGKIEGKMESGSFKQTGRFKAEKKKESALSDENNEYNPDVKSENGSSEAAPDIKKDTQEYEDDTYCKKIDNIAEKERSHVELAYQNDKSAEFKSDFNVKTEGNECNGDKSQHDVEPKEEKQTKQDEHKENVIFLKFDFDSLTNRQKQTICETRRIVHTQLENQVVKSSNG
ncbi:DOS-like protein [Mya arenaria]|uniref:DOS-like protein n=1 Tax=Mya arenaria TaxID=6604 RepID=A0ABY7DN34_MYAAR|nr:DOS-like protein [Mya arenaria]